MNTKHTPGPWRVDDFGCVCGSGKVVAAPYDLRDDDTSEEQEANALLIAAAPDLLEALKKTRAALLCADAAGIPVDEELAQLDAAIAKATGTTNL